MNLMLKLLLVRLASFAMGFIFALMLSGKDFTPHVGAVFIVSAAAVAYCLLTDD